MEEKEEKTSKTVVKIIDNGPLIISGNFIFQDIKRNIESNPGKVELCRCGRSRNKPFCDCSHKE
jgi:CDGSH-type Zn-finger protein